MNQKVFSKLCEQWIGICASVEQVISVIKYQSQQDVKPTLYSDKVAILVKVDGILLRQWMFVASSYPLFWRDFLVLKVVLILI